MTAKEVKLCLERCERIERAGVNTIKDLTNRLASMQLITETFEMIRKDPGSAYVRLMKAALGQPSSAKPEYINRIAILGRLSGYALMYTMQDEGMFTRIMGINEKPVVQ